jgi:hypothetical protein
MSGKLLTFDQASALARTIAKDFKVKLVVKAADRDWIPTAIACYRDGCIELFIPSRVRLDSLAFEMSLCLQPLPAKYQHWRRTANGRLRPDSALRNQCRKRALELAREALPKVRGAA